MTKQDRKERLKARMTSNVANKDQYSDNSTGAKYLKLGKVDYYTPVEGKNKIDIIPYIVKTKNHPQKIGVGEEDYILDVWVYRFVGIKKDSFVCLFKTLGKPCPICEERKKLYDAGDEKMAESIKPQRRAVYNVIDLNSDDDGIKIFDTSYALFEKEMLDELQSFADDGEIPAIADLDEGMSVSFRASEQAFNKNKYLEFKRFDFVERKKGYSESILENSISLDQALVIPTYEQVSNSFFGNDVDEDDDDDGDDKPVKKPSKKVDEDEDEKPTRKSKKVDDEDDDDKPAKRVEKAVKGTPSCPFTFEFGTDYLMDDACDDCPVKKECRAENRG